MATVYVHIGMPKTGTTYLQNFLEANETLLNRQGYTFPIFDTPFERIAKERNAFFLKHKVYTQYENSDSAIEKETYEKHMKKIAEIGKTYPNIILSNESHWNSKTIPWADIQKDFANIGLSLKLIVYLRRQDAFAQSLFAQKVKTGYTKSYENFIASDFFHEYYLDYYKRLNELSDEIGRENLIVRTYDKARFQRTNHTVTSDFLEAIGLTETDEYVSIENTNMNPSLFGPYLEVKRLLNQNPVFKTRQNFGTKLLINLIAREGNFIDFNSNQFLSRRARRKFLRQFEESNVMVAKKYLHRNDGILFEEIPHTKKETKRITYDSNELIQICGDMLIEQQKTIDDLKQKLKNFTL